MRALLVYDSELDNAAMLAREVAAGFGDTIRVSTAAVGSAPDPLPGPST